MKLYIKRLLLFAVQFLAIQGIVKAGVEPYENFIRGIIRVGDSLEIKDEKFRNPLYNWNTIFSTSVKNIVSLRLYEAEKAERNFSCMVNVRITSYQNPDQTVPVIKDTVLRVNYNSGPGVSYQQEDSYLFSQSHLVKVVITGISSAEYGHELPAVLQLENRIIIERKYEFQAGAPLGLTGYFLVTEESDQPGLFGRFFNTSSFVNNNHQLALTWEGVPGAEEYDLEWAYIDEGSVFEQRVKEMDSLNQALPEALRDEIFRNNSGRITTNGTTNYNLSLVGNAKYIIVRIRQVKYVTDGVREEGNWDYNKENDRYAIWKLDTWHEENLNWQYTASYAEEGKKKEVISYFDGSLRPRQTVTLNNTGSDIGSAEPVAVVQEDVFDPYGRKTASILPSPVKEETGTAHLRYFKDFNLNAQDSVYSVSDIKVQEGDCEFRPEMLSSAIGAGKYYSPLNQFLPGSGNNFPAYNRYIPDAEGYPLSVTRYMPDATGRISMQGGVGSAFQPSGTADRTTRYYYSKPEQWELDRLFGNDVGYAYHYQKLMVKDPNGQLSISYQNASGKTIATALAGSSPAGIDILDSGIGSVSKDTSVVLRPSQFSYDVASLKLKGTTAYMTSIPGNAVLKYDIEQLISNYPGNNFQTCSNCYYELRVQVKDDCQAVLYDNTNIPFTVGFSVPTPGAEAWYTGYLPQIYFQKAGVYAISFELAMNRRVIEDFTERFVTDGQSAGALYKEFDFIQKQLDSLNITGCFNDCQTCEENLGTRNSFISAFRNSLLATQVDSESLNSTAFNSWLNQKYDSLYTHCMSLKEACRTPAKNQSPCAVYEAEMLRDVSPGGQYALFDTNGQSLETPYNVLAKIVNGKENWRNRFIQDAVADSIDMVTLPDGRITSPHASDFTLQMLLKYWKEHWAYRFLEDHPEHCKLLRCNTIKTYLEWDRSVKEGILTAADIQYIPETNNLSYSPNDVTWLLAADPFFKQGNPGASLYNGMLSSLTNYKAIYDGQNSYVKNLNTFTDYTLYCSLDLNSWSTCNPDPACRIVDREWEFYKEAYFALKESIYKNYFNQCSLSCGIGIMPEEVDNNCLLTSDFKLEPYFSIDGQVPYGMTGCTGTILKITYQKNLQKTVMLKFYVPEEYKGLMVDSVLFQSYNPEVYLCVPSTLPINVVKLKSACQLAECYYVDVTGNWEKQYTQQYKYKANKDTENQSITEVYTPTLLTLNYNGTYSITGANAGSGIWSRNAVNCELKIGQTDYKIDKVDDRILILKRLVGNVVYEEHYTKKRTDGKPILYGEYFWTDNKSTVTEQDDIYTFVIDDYPFRYTQISISKTNTSANWGQTVEQSSAQSVTTYNNGLRVVCEEKDYIFEGVVYVKKYERGYSTLPSVDASYPNTEANFFHALADCRFSNYVIGDRAQRYLFKSNPGLKICPEMTGDNYGYNGSYEVRDYWGNSLWGDDVWFDETGKDVFVVPLWAENGNFEYQTAAKVRLVGWPFCNNNSGPPLCAELWKYKTPRFAISNSSSNLNLSDVMKDYSERERDKLSYYYAEDIATSLSKNFVTLDPSSKEDLGYELAYLHAYTIDENHPIGASSLPTGHNFYASSFGDLIKFYLNINAFTPDINPWLIDGIYPYEVKTQLTDVSIIHTDSEIATKLNTFKQEAVNAGKPLYTYLKDRYKDAMTLTEVELSALIKACDTCGHVLAVPINLPVFLEPGTKGCIMKSEFDAAWIDLANELPALQPTHTFYETIVSNFMNYRWGFSLGYDDYRAYQEILLTHPNEILCNRRAYRTEEADPYACLKTGLQVAVASARQTYAAYINEEKDKFRAAYINTCSAAKASVQLITEQQIYHYTLYYYDEGGNLVRTVPPEGVQLLNASQIKQADRVRVYGKTESCNYEGPVTASNQIQAFSHVANLLGTANTGALELWMYNSGGTGGQTIFTAGGQYMLNFCITADRLSAEIYHIDQSNPNVADINLSRHYSSNLAGKNVFDWNHIVLQGDLSSASNVQLWFNGDSLQVNNEAALCGWEVSGMPVQWPSYTEGLKHLRLYQRQLSRDEIRKNADNGCFMPLYNTYLAWHRFNIPNANTATTVGTGTQETQYKGVYPMHTLQTSYAYNSMGQVVKQYTPDADTSRFWYDKLGRMAVSRNAKQEVKGNYSYTLYDALGRIKEVGQKETTYNLPAAVSFLQENTLDTFRTGGTDSEIVSTYYNEPLSGAPQGQDNLRNRVAASIYKEVRNAADSNATYYSYDISGNVKRLHQYIQGLGYKKIDYGYDQASGKVNYVAYQHDSLPATDRFYYKYKYDAENRLIEAYSGTQALRSDNGNELTLLNGKLNASYRYYLHGPLARVELGDNYNRVQGMDYAYTLQGWLKGINGQSLSPATDIGGDGQNGSTIGKDALAYSLGYYQGDYKPIGGTIATAFGNGYTASAQNITGHDLYNGNISQATYGIEQIDNGQTAGYTYAYDQLNRLVRKNFHSISENGIWSVSSNAYSENFSYDANGNLLKLNRYGTNANSRMDSLAYRYFRNGSKQKLLNNRLHYVNDYVNGSLGSYDLASQPVDNYQYDEIGNLTRDSIVGISNISWNVYGKIKGIVKTGNAPGISYRYDAAGNRVSKLYDNTVTYYVRDAQGNPLAVYEQKADSTMWKEQQLYGSSRLGMWKPELNLANGDAATVWNATGNKFFELNNHLGNVMAVITDKRVLVGNGYGAEIVNAQDYYAFGSQMPERAWSLGDAYRYGFNGKENDNEVDGQQDYGMRIYDKRIGRFKSVDPITKEYPELTPYQFASNRPIDGIDLDGLEYLNANDSRVQFRFGRLELKISNFLQINQNAWINANKDPNNWTYTDGKKDIGINPTIANINLIGPQFSALEAKDIPDLPSSVTGMVESGYQTQGYNRAGRREIARKGPMLNMPGKQGGMARGLAVLDGVTFGLDQYIKMSWIYDQNKVEEHRKVASKVAANVTDALNSGMIREKYQNKRDISNIMNVVLQGVNNSNDQGIYDLGMDIYNKYKPETVTIPSGLDNQKSKTYTVPKLKEGVK